MTTTQIENAISSQKANSDRLHFVHIPTPGDHYSPATGSAVMTVIHGLTASHVAAGRQATILVSRGTTVNYPPYAAGKTQEIDLPTRLPSRFQKLCDAALGRFIKTRPSAAGQYRAAADHLGNAFEGTVFVHNAPAAIPLLRRNLPHARIALYAHNQLFNTYSAREVRFVIDHSDAVLCVSNFIARDIATRAGRTSNKLKVVLNGVDTAMFTPTPAQIQTRVSQASTGEIPIILFLGRVQPEKGPDLLLKAAAQLDIPFRIHIVGSSNFNARDPLTTYEQELRILAEPLGDKVVFLPFVPRAKVAAEYHRATIFVAPSNWDEPFGLTVAEALAAGVPSVLSQRGGIPEVAADAALYFAPPDTATLARHLRDLLTQPALRAELSQKSLRRAEVLQWENRYLDMLSALGLDR